MLGSVHWCTRLGRALHPELVGKVKLLAPSQTYGSTASDLANRAWVVCYMLSFQIHWWGSHKIRCQRELVCVGTQRWEGWQMPRKLQQGYLSGSTHTQSPHGRVHTRHTLANPRILHTASTSQHAAGFITFFQKQTKSFDLAKQRIAFPADYRCRVAY